MRYLKQKQVNKPKKHLICSLVWLLACPAKHPKKQKELGWTAMGKFSTGWHTIQAPYHLTYTGPNNVQ